jgi:hypothetical protein
MKFFMVRVWKHFLVSSLLQTDCGKGGEQRRTQSLEIEQRVAQSSACKQWSRRAGLAVSAAQQIIEKSVAPVV